MLIFVCSPVWRSDHYWRSESVRHHSVSSPRWRSLILDVETLKNVTSPFNITLSELAKLERKEFAPMKAKIRTCPFDNCLCQLDCPDRHPDRSGCRLTDTLDAGQDALVFNNPTGEVLMFF